MKQQIPSGWGGPMQMSSETAVHKFCTKYFVEFLVFDKKKGSHQVQMGCSGGVGWGCPGPWVRRQNWHTSLQGTP